MVRETRHLWVGNLPDNIREDRIREHFKRYGRVQNVKLLGKTENSNTTPSACSISNSGICATVAFMDIKSASKAHNAEHILDERTLTTEYYEPTAIPTAAGAPSAGSSPAGSGYSGSSSSVNSTPIPISNNRFHMNSEDSTANACLAAATAAPATWRGTNDSASEYCRRGNTPTTYGRYQRNNSNAPYATPPSNVDRNTPHHRWYASGERAGGATGGESTPSTPGGGTEGGRRRRHSGSGSSRSDSSSPEPSDNSRSSTPAAPQSHPHHPNHRQPTAHPHQWASTANGRPLAICVRNLPTRSTDSSLKDGLYHEYKKHGKVVWVKVVGQNADRYAVVRFKKPSDVEKALEVSQDKLFFGCKISVAPHQSCDEDADSAKPYETDIDEYHPKATRTLFIGNLEKDVTQPQLREKFKHFGRIIEIDIKKGSGGGAGYAFCQYASISSVVEAIRAMDGEHVGGSRVKLGFGKPVATTCVWVDGLTEHTEKQVLGAVSRCGAATSVCVDRAAGAALVHFEQAAAAGAAVRELRRVAAQLSALEPTHPRLCVDYASRECQEAFYEQLEKHGGTAALTGSERLSGDVATRYLQSSRHEPARFDGSGTRSRASSYGRGSSRNPRFAALDHYDPADYAADRRYREYDEVGSSPQPEDVSYDERLQSVVVSPHRGRRHRIDSSPEERKHSKERHWNSNSSAAGGRRSRSGSRGVERHAARRRHRRRRDGSRAGTPLRDEPDAPPTEPRRPPAPRERPQLPMSLPLPKFAAQLLRTTPSTPRPVPAPAPASPPRPPSASSSSAGSAPHSPSLEERIRSLDEKYERWNGSRVLSDTPDRTRLRHRLLEIDINEVKPSDVVLSLLSKRSVFDEDSERLEGATRVPSPAGSPRSRPSPCVPRALRYPFPSHSVHVNRSSTPILDNDIDSTDRSLDPRLNRVERHYVQEKLMKINEGEYRSDSKLRLRTPSTDKSQPESNECKSSPSIDKERKDNQEPKTYSVIEKLRRDSLCNEANSIIENNTKDIKDTQSTQISSQLEIAENLKENKPVSEVTKNDGQDQRKTENLTKKIGEGIQRSTSEIKEVGLKQFETVFIKSELENTKLDNTTDSLPDTGSKLDNPKKLDNSKLVNDYCSEAFAQNFVKNELSEYEIQENYINALNSIKTGPEISKLITVKSEEKKLKDSYQNHTIYEKEITGNLTQFLNEKNIEHNIQKFQTDCSTSILSKNYSEKSEKQVDNDNGKLKNFKDEKCFEDDTFSKICKNLKEECKNEKFHSERIKFEKDNTKITKVERDLEKSKIEMKARNDLNKKEKPEKDKKKDLNESDATTGKFKKEDKHNKHDRLKKDWNDIKRDSKKESDSIKSRKPSRDENLRDYSRKDSTDSSASKTSLELPKPKELDNNDIKDENEKLKNKLANENLQKHKVDKECINENKEDKILPENTRKVDSKSKNDTTEKQRHYSLDSPSIDSKRKERLNSCSSLPSNIGNKRRMSSQDSLDSLNDDHFMKKSKLPERRDSKECRNIDRHKTTKFNKCHFAKIIESKTKDDKKNQVKPPDHPITDWTDSKVHDKKPSKKGFINETTKLNTTLQSDGLHNDIDFLATLELRSSEEDEKQKALRKEMKEKKRIQQLQQIQQFQMQQDALQAELINKVKDDKRHKENDKKRETLREKRISTDRKSRDEKMDNIKKRNRKNIQSTDSSDSDEPKKHSIFDIIDDGPTYISMYDKVKARSCKNMQKQEEEKRQEKIKAKFSQLKQSRAKREEKKRSSWDEDSDSDVDRRKSIKTSIDTSSEEDQITVHNRKRENLQSNFRYDQNRSNDYIDISNNEDETRNKLSRKNSRSRIISDTSDDEKSKRSISPNYLNALEKDINFDSATSQDPVKHKNLTSKDSHENKIKKNSILNLFGKSDSDDSKVRMNVDTGKPNYVDFSSESESAMFNRHSGELRKKHKKKQKKHKFSFSDEDKKDSTSALEDLKHKQSQKPRRHSTKKERRKEKIRESIDTDDPRDGKCLKKSKNFFDSSSEVISNHNKREGKMEDIFGPLSDDSDQNSGVQNRMFSLQSYESKICLPSNQPSTTSINEDNKLREEKRKKDKKRKEKRNFVKDDDNSLDVDAVSKAIEARLFADSLSDYDNSVKTENILDGVVKHKDQKTESKSGNDKTIAGEHNKMSDKTRRDSKEKKKKKKRNKEDRQIRKDYHLHVERPNDSEQFSSEKSEVDIMHKTILSDIPLPVDAQDEKPEKDDCQTMSSLPRLTESPPFSEKLRNEMLLISECNDDSVLEADFAENKIIEIETIPMPPPIINNVVEDISKVPLPEDPAPQKPNFIKDDSVDSIINLCSDISENAVRSISNMERDCEKNKDINDTNLIKVEEKVEEKPRAIISQEETEDAVAALLGESFGEKNNTFEDCYDQTESNSGNGIENSTIENANIREEDAEEMRRAVQNLNASEMEIKPDTPLSDNDLLLIDTDTEEAEENAQDAIEKLPVNIIATTQSVNPVNTTKATPTSNSSIIIKSKLNTIPEPPKVENSVNSKLADNVNDLPRVKRENQQLTSTATPVITSWTLSNNKSKDTQALNVQKSPLPKEQVPVETKSINKIGNIVQIKTQNQNLQNTMRPIITPGRVSAPYQVINQMIRSPVPNLQPPSIKIPDSHILYQKPPGVVISPRIANEPRLHSPKSSPQEALASPRLSNKSFLSNSPQNLNSIVLPSPNTIPQRSPGQVTVVRMQQPPLSPIQTMHLPHARTMLSPTRPTSVLVQAQGSPIHFNRLPVTPVLAPISKPTNIGSPTSVSQPIKTVNMTTTQLMHQQKLVTGECRKNDPRNFNESKNENSKIILSPTNYQQSTNPTVMAQNRLMSMQNSVHVGNLNHNNLHLSNKVLNNNIHPVNEKRDNQKLEHTPFSSTSMIHVTGVNHTTSNMKNNTKPIMCTFQDTATANRGQGSNVIHSLNTRRIISATPVTNILHVETNKSSPSVLSVASIRPPTVVTKLNPSNTIAATTASHTNVVMTPLLLKNGSVPSAIRIQPQTDQSDNKTPVQNILKDEKALEKIQPLSNIIHESLDKHETSNIKSSLPVEHNITKCETDFEELLKDNTNEIKVRNSPEKKLEVNKGQTVTLITTNTHSTQASDNIDPLDRKSNTSNIKDSEESNKENNNLKDQQPEDNIHKKDTPCSQSYNCTEENLPITCSTDTPNISMKDTNIEGISKNNNSTVDVKITTETDAVKNIKEDDVLLKDEQDKQSLKILNVESVIKKLDTQNNVNTSDKASTDILEKPVEFDVICPKIVVANNEISNNHMGTKIDTQLDHGDNMFNEIVQVRTVPSKRGGRSIRGRRVEKTGEKVQTRQISKPVRGTSGRRGRGRAKVDKKIKNLVHSTVSNMPGDIYDFHEDSGDETTTSPQKSEARPRLILTIKSPLSGHSNALVTSTLSITQREELKNSDKNVKDENFVSPSSNTRKSRRLQEKDVHKNVAEDLTEDTAKNFSNSFKSGKKKATRQTGLKANNREKPMNITADVRKSPRGVKRTRDRSLSEASIDSNEDRSKKDIPREPKTIKLQEPSSQPLQSLANVEIQPDVGMKVPISTIAPQTQPIHVPTPITKPPKKMISEISAKLASALEATPPPVVAFGGVAPGGGEVPAERTPARAECRVAPARDPEFASSMPAGGTAHSGGGEAKAATGETRVETEVEEARLARLMIEAAAAEAGEPRVQSPALPHRGVRVLREWEESEGARRYGASLPRGAHHPPPAAPAAPAPAPAPAPALLAKQVAVVGPHHLPGVASRVTITSVPAISPQGQVPLSAELVRSPPPAHQHTSPVTPGDGMYYSHQHYQMYQQHFHATQHETRTTPSPYFRGVEEGCEAPTPPLELRRPPSARVPRPAHSPAPAPADRLARASGAMCGRSPPPAHGTSRLPAALPPPGPPGPMHGSQVPREADSLQMLLRRYPVMWQGLLALKNDSAAVQMHFVGGNPGVAASTLQRHADGSTPPLRIAQRMRLEPLQLDQVHRKMKMENEHCILLALPCGRDHMDVLQQSNNLTAGFITYLQSKQAAGIVNVAPPGHQQAMYTVHIFPSCDFANENLNRIAPDLMHRVADIAHLLIVIATV